MIDNLEIPKRRTFDNRLVEDLATRTSAVTGANFQVFHPQRFDFNSYEFADGDTNHIRA